MLVLVVSHTFSDIHEIKVKKNEHYLCEMILLTDKDVSTNEVSQFNIEGPKKHLLDTCSKWLAKFDTWCGLHSGTLIVFRVTLH